jgi:hypothetical protein
MTAGLGQALHEKFPDLTAQSRTLFLIQTDQIGVRENGI